MTDKAQAVEQPPQQLPVATYRPSSDGNIEELWQGIERAYKISRQHNHEVLRDHIAISTATALTFSNQLLHAGLLNPPPDVEISDDEYEEILKNPTQPETPQQKKATA